MNARQGKNLASREKGFAVRLLMLQNRKEAVGYTAGEVILEQGRSVPRDTGALGVMERS